jgi:hypothetical protein
MLKNFVEHLMYDSCLYDAPGDMGGGGGGGTDAGTPAADNDGKPQAGNDDKGGKKPGDGNPPAGKLEDDPRYKGMLADLQKERKARQALEQGQTATRAELEQERRRVQALAGVNPKSKEEEDEALIRERLERLYPWMKDLSADDIAAMRDAQARLKGMEDVTVSTWRAHSQKMLDSVADGVQKALGGKLTDRQIARLQSAYVEEAKADPAFLRRHEAGDPKLVAEFVAGWIEDFVEPGKRQALAAEAARRPRVPGGKDRSVVGSGGKPIDVKDDKAVEDMLVAGFKERGGQFGRH